VAYVSKHDGEEKREGHAGQHRWVGFLITSDAISVHHFLEEPGKLIRFKTGRRSQTCPFYLLDKHQLLNIGGVAISFRATQNGFN